MYSNKEIIDGFCQNDQTIIKILYKKLHPVIMNWIKKNNGTVDDTEDILQEAFLIIIRKLKTEGLNLNCNFSTYFFSICKHLWFQELRNRSRVKLKEMQEFYWLANEVLEYDELEEKKLKLFLKQINLLEEKCRQLLLLYCKKKSISEIMKLMGFKNEQAVADKKKNCRKKLIKNLLNCKEYKELQNEILITY